MWTTATVLHVLLDAVIDDAYVERREMLVDLFLNMESAVDVDDLGVSSLAVPREATSVDGRFHMIAVVHLAITLVSFEPASQRAVQVMRFFAAIFPSLLRQFPEQVRDLSDTIDQFIRTVVGVQLESVMYVAGPHVFSRASSSGLTLGRRARRTDDAGMPSSSRRTTSRGG